jgi:hypothetical protein
MMLKQCMPVGRVGNLPVVYGESTGEKYTVPTVAYTRRRAAFSEERDSRHVYIVQHVPS